MRDLPYSATIKTSPPSATGVIDRPRLISALANLPAASKWLQAPSGSGKSTLAASWARKGTKPFAWYRLDERDNDPAFFYGEFAHAVRTQLRLSDALPKFSADDHERQQVFARRFFAELTAHIDEATLVVLDDMHRLTTDSMLSSLTELIALSGKQVELLFVSEASAPTAFFNAITARQLALLNDADLRFEIAECKAMTAALRIDGTQCETIAALTSGHAGALVLACELLRGTDPASAIGIETVERIYTHLLSKLVERMPQHRRHLLLQTTFVTQLTRPIAAALAGEDAALQLDALVESGLMRRAGEAAAEVFEVHGLVRQGMQALTRARVGQLAARALAEQTATTLDENGQSEAAFALLVEIGSTARAINVMQQVAEQYATQGQVDLLMSALAKLPAAEVQKDAWLCFWTGQTSLRIDEEQARAWFAHAYTAFQASSDALGIRLAAASMVITFGLEHADLRELELWIQRHRDAGGETPVAPNERFETTLVMAIVCAALMQGAYPTTIKAHDLIPRLQQLLELDSVWLSDDQRVQAGRLLITHARIFRSEILAPNAIVVTRRLIQDGVGGSLHRGRWLIAAAYVHLEKGHASASFEYLQQARTLALQSNSVRLQFELSFALTDHWMKAQMLPQAAEELDRLEHLAGAVPPAQRAEFARMMARVLLLQDQYAEGLRWAEDAMRLAVPAGFSGANLSRFEVELVYALAANDRLEDALTLIKRHGAAPKEVGIAIAHCLEFLVTGANDLQLLRIGLKNAQQMDFLNLFDRARRCLTQVCEAALAHDIEPEFVRRLIAVKKLQPSPLAGPTWPWPIRVSTLGEFRLEINDRPYRPSHKAQDKPLELLKLLVTCQILGREFAEKSWIAERLWPDADLGSGRKSLDMSISRLRKLLECEDSIVVNEGRLQLSPQHVWTDVKPLREALADVRAARDKHASGRLKATDRAAASVKAVLAYYKGVYLAEEDGPPWLLAGREAVAASVRHALLTADSILAGSADTELIPALQRALLHDPSSEDMARALMRAHLRRGRNSEALGVYRQLRDMLSLLMGLAPSPETEHIRKQALLQESRTPN